MQPSISYPPIPIFEVGSLRLSLHGVFAAIGFLAGAWLATREVRRRGFDAGRFQSVLTWALVGALLGARLFTVPAHLGDAGYGLDDVVNPAGTYSIMGGMAGGILAGWLRLRLLGMPLLPFVDAAAPGLALGTVVGRIGDLIIVEHLGRATSFFLGYAIKAGYDVAPQHDALECAGPAGTVCGIYHHAALYDLLGAAVLLGALLVLRRRWITRHYGQLFALWAGWYGLQRFLIDFLRFGSGDATLGPLTWNQVSGLAAAVGAGALLAALRRQPQVSAQHDAALGAEPQQVEVAAD